MLTIIMQSLWVPFFNSPYLASSPKSAMFMYSSSFDVSKSSFIPVLFLSKSESTIFSYDDSLIMVLTINFPKGVFISHALLFGIISMVRAKDSPSMAIISATKTAIFILVFFLSFFFLAACFSLLLSSSS